MTNYVLKMRLNQIDMINVNHYFCKNKQNEKFEWTTNYNKFPKLLRFLFQNEYSRLYSDYTY